PMAAAAALTVAAGVVMLSKHAPAVPQLLTAHSLGLGVTRPAADRPVCPIALAGSLARTSHPQLASARGTSMSEPEVLVPREEIEMYRRLIAEAQKASAAIVVERPQVTADIPLFPEITIDPIKIELMSPPVGGEGERK